MPDNAFKHREAWLHAVADQMRPLFGTHGAEIPDKIPLSCGFPSARALSANGKRLGECWSHTESKDGHVEIMISPVLADPMRVAGVLAHELVHATGRHGHGRDFAMLAKAIGLEGKMTATTEGEFFRRTVEPIIDAVGPYPHAELTKTARPKQTTRLLKLQCPTCAYTVRITRKWLDDVGPPNCPSHGEDMHETAGSSG